MSRVFGIQVLGLGIRVYVLGLEFRVEGSDGWKISKGGQRLLLRNRDAVLLRTQGPREAEELREWGVGVRV